MAAVLSVVGAVVGAIGQIAAANAQARAAEYNQQVAERNKLAILAQTDEEAADQARENRRNLGTIRAAYGAAGIDLAGSPLDVIQDTAIEGATDVARVQYEGKLRAIDQQDKATLAGMEAKADRTAGMFSAVGTLFGGFANAGVTLARA